MSEMVTINIDGIAHQVEAGTNLLQACLSLQLDMPYFCWHPALGSAGSCRQCAVIQYQNAEDQRGRLVMSCMTPVSDGMIVSMNTEKASGFRATAIEAIMTNHPHDCPVCEEGGDCHLQDMTLLSGHIKRQYPGSKRTHLNQYLGPLLNHEMNRCIGCYRCVRFYRDYCGGDDLNVFSSRNQIYFGRAESGTLESPFSGNLAEVCPTGVFTDKTFSEHYSRKWDLASAPTICSHCSVGCNTYTAERGGIVRRVNNRLNPQINQHFICDRGRFGYQHVNHNERLEQAWSRPSQPDQKVEVLSQQQALAQLESFIDDDVVVVGSGRSVLENNISLRKVATAENFYVACEQSQLEQWQMLLQCYQNSDLEPASLSQLEACDTMLLVGEDPGHTAPRLALSIRQMTRNAGIAKAAKLGIKDWQDEAVRNITQDLRSPLHIVHTHQSSLDDLACSTLCYPPAKQMALLLEVESILKQPADIELASPQARQISTDLNNAKAPALVTGSNNGHPGILAVCLRIALRLKQQNPNSRFYCTTEQANSLALAVLTEPQQAPQSLQMLAKRMETQAPKTLLIMEADLYRYFDAAYLDKLLDNIEHIVVIDQLLTRTAQMADLLLPSCSFAETHGHWLSAEGRLQRHYATMPAIKSRLSAWQWLQNISRLTSTPLLLQWAADKFPLLSRLEQDQDEQNQEFALARQPLRSTGRTAINAATDVKEYPPQIDQGSQLTFSMEGVPAFRQHQLHQQTSPPSGMWLPKWNSSQGVNKQLASPQDKRQNELLLSGNNNGSLELLYGQKSAICSDRVKLCPDHHIYADDELLEHTSLSQLIPSAQAKMSQAQADALQLKPGDPVYCKGQQGKIELPCAIANVAMGVVLIPWLSYLRLGHDRALCSASHQNQPTQGASHE